MSEASPPCTSNPSRFLLVRHGQTEWNLEGRYQGQSDPPLSSLGMEQARALTTRLPRMNIQTLVSSPLQRARETALPIAKHLDLDLVLDARLGEITYGRWEGLTQLQIKALWPDALHLWKRHPDLYPPVGGEPLPLAATRIKQCLDDLTNSCAGPILLVTHAGIIRLALILSTQAPLSTFREIKVPHAEIITMNWTVTPLEDRGI